MNAYGVEMYENEMFQSHYLFYLKDIKEQRVGIKKIFEINLISFLMLCFEKH